MLLFTLFWATVALVSRVVRWNTSLKIFTFDIFLGPPSFCHVHCTLLQLRDATCSFFRSQMDPPFHQRSVASRQLKAVRLRAFYWSVSLGAMMTYECFVKLSTIIGMSRWSYTCSLSHEYVSVRICIHTDLFENNVTWKKCLWKYSHKTEELNINNWEAEKWHLRVHTTVCLMSALPFFL